MHLQGYLDFLRASGGQQLAASLASWRSGIAYEQDFWTRWFATGGGQWAQEFEARMQRRELLPVVVNRLPASPKARVLDVGAGPATNIGSYVAGRDIEVVAVDPLATIYDHIIATTVSESTGQTNTRRPPVPTRFAFAEDLSARFEPSSFDVITCTNALDHAIEPAWGILEMLLVLKPGARIYLGHTQNEAVAENYCGFHQWNFDIEGSDFIIWNASRRLNATQLFASFADVRANMPAPKWVVVDITKRSEPPFDVAHYHRGMRGLLLEAMLLATPELASIRGLALTH
jgi:SAM-dependent methyltransferase